MKKILAFAVFICSLSFPSIAHAACSTYPYKSNYYDGGSWVNFDDNTRAQQLISSRQAEDILSIDENGDGYLFTNDTYFSCSKPRLTVQSTGSRGLFIPGQYNHLGTQSIRNKFLDLANKLNSWMSSNPIVVPTTTTTTTVPPTTTTVPLTYYCILPAGTGYQLYWKNSADVGYSNPSLLTTPGSWAYLTSEATWREMTGQTKYNLHQTQLKEIAIKPVPSAGCSSLNEDLSYIKVVTTTTTTTVPTPPVTTIPLTTTTTTTITVAPTTTTTIYNPRITYCQATMTHYVNSVPQWNYANWQQGNEPLSTYTSSALVYPNSFRYPVPVAGCSSLNTTPTTTTTTIVAPVVQQQAPAAPAQPAKPAAPVAPAQPAKPAAPVAPAIPVQPPAVQTPTATLPKAQPPVVQAPAIPLKPKWKYVDKLVLQTVYSNVKTGAVCKNGSTANTNHPLTCLKQGGVKKWIYLPSKKIYVNKKHICYLNKSTNKYTKNCKLV